MDGGWTEKRSHDEFLKPWQGKWSAGLINGPACIATFVPCLACVWTWSNARKVGQPGLIASQGCLCVYCCFPCSLFMWITKDRFKLDSDWSIDLIDLWLAHRLSKKPDKRHDFTQKWDLESLMEITNAVESISASHVSLDRLKRYEIQIQINNSYKF